MNICKNVPGPIKKRPPITKKEKLINIIKNIQNHLLDDKTTLLSDSKIFLTGCLWVSAGKIDSGKQKVFQLFGLLKLKKSGDVFLRKEIEEKIFWFSRQIAFYRLQALTK